MANDGYDLERFVEAQDGLMTQIVIELTTGQKQSHWMWFVFPQLAGLGHSSMAQHYAIASTHEAMAYLDHPVLGPRLRHCTELVNRIEERTVSQIFGSPDDMKFRSSMTLFDTAAPTEAVFSQALTRYFEGQGDPITLSLLERVTGDEAAGAQGNVESVSPGTRRA